MLVLFLLAILAIFFIDINCSNLRSLKYNNRILQHNNISSDINQCKPGKYIFDGECHLYNQGIGSSLNQIKFIILASNVFQLEIIPDPKCFNSQEHETFLYNEMGWNYNSNCSTEYILNPNNKDKIIQYDVRIIHNDMNEFNQICRLVGNENNKVDLTKSEFKRGGLFYELQVAIMKSNFISASNLKPVIFSINKPLYTMNVANYICTRKFIYDHYFLRFNNQREIKFDKNKINIAFHFRYGDTSKDDNNLAANPNYNGEDRRFPLLHGIQLIQNLLSDNSNLKKSECQIYFYSEGLIDVFSQFTDAFPSAIMVLGNKDTAINDLDHMAHSDVFMGGPSSFSTLGNLICIYHSFLY